MGGTVVRTLPLLIEAYYDDCTPEKHCLEVVSGTTKSLLMSEENVNCAHFLSMIVCRNTR